MQLLSWLRKRITHRAQYRPTPRFRPRLEALEGRDVPSTLTVTNNFDSGPGSLRAEIAAARNKDTIVFAPTLDGQTITLTSGELLINKNLTINGAGAGEVTVSGNNSSRIFEVPNKSQLALIGLTISHGSSSYGGGISVNPGGTLTISNSKLSADTAPNGGAIYNGGSVTISNSTLSADTAGSGGAIANYGTLTITGCTLSANSVYLAGYGGAITNQGGSLSISDSTLSGNSGGSVGGAVWSSGTLNVSGCTFIDNSATNGGAIYIFNNQYPVPSSSAQVFNSTFINNSPDAIEGLYSGYGNTFN